MRDVLLFEFVLDVSTASLLLWNSSGSLCMQWSGSPIVNADLSHLVKGLTICNHVHISTTLPSTLLLSLHIPCIDAARRVTNNLLDDTPLLEIDECLASERAVNL